MCLLSEGRTWLERGKAQSTRRGSGPGIPQGSRSLGDKMLSSLSWSSELGIPLLINCTKKFIIANC